MELILQQFLNGLVHSTIQVLTSTRRITSIRWRRTDVNLNQCNLLHYTTTGAPAPTIVSNLQTLTTHLLESEA